MGEADTVGTEQAELSIGAGGLVATSVTLGSVPMPYRLDLDLTLAVTLDEQQYRLLGVDHGNACVRFENGDGFFTAVIRCDADGVALEYPGIARRVL